MTNEEQRQLDRIEAKLDAHYEQLVQTKVELASHKSKAGHDEQVRQLENLKYEVTTNRTTLRAWGLVFGGLVLVANLAGPWVIRVITS